MPPAGFEPTIPASERSLSHALDRAATGIGLPSQILTKNFYVSFKWKLYNSSKPVTGIEPGMGGLKTGTI